MKELLSYFILSAAAWCGDPSIRGRVVDPSGALAPSALVRLYSRDSTVQRTAQADDNGLFEFGELPRGSYLLEAATQGLDQASPMAVQVEAGKTSEVELTLRVSQLATRVEVTATSTPQIGTEGGKALDQLDAASLERRGEFALSESLREVPGLRVQQLGGPGAFTRILTRGLRATDTAILMDGVRLRDSASIQSDGTAYLADLLMVNSDRVEVLRGSGSSLYGTNAMSGVINMVTDAGGGRFHGDVSAEGGGLGLFRGSARGAGGAFGDRLAYSAGVAHLNVSSGTEGIEWVRNTTAQGAALYRLIPAMQVSARLFGIRSAANVTTNPEAAPAELLPAQGVVTAVPVIGSALELAQAGKPFPWGSATFLPNLYDPDSRRSSEVLSGLFAWSYQMSPRANYRVSYHMLSSGRGAGDAPTGPGMWQPMYNSQYRYDGRVDTLQARGDFTPVRRHLVSAGYEYERERSNSRSWDMNPDPTGRVDARTEALQESGAVFAQDQMRFFADRLQVSFSGRFQHFKLTPPEFSGGTPSYQGAKFDAPPNALTGDVAVAYFAPNTGTKFRAHAGNAYRAPSLYERFGAYFFLGSFSALGDPRLRPERSVSVDGGFDQYFAGNRFRASVTYFYSRLQEVIGFGMLENDPFGRWGGYVNTPGGLARGVEVSGEARPWRRALVQASYTYTNADERQSNLVGGSLRSIRVFPQAFTLVATQEITRRLQVTFDFLGASRYIAGTFFVGSGNRPFEFAGPKKLDSSVSYTLPLSDRRSLRFFTRIENLLNREYYEDGFRTPRVWAVAGMKLLF